MFENTCRFCGGEVNGRQDDDGSVHYACKKCKAEYTLKVKND